ncbi:MAG: hypothetical protein E7466_01885 [Ruminococcaceae bacterium]|nr:hypothetical protein [Oscillospiraceae bacterium]
MGITSMVMSIAGTFLSLIFSLASVGQMHSWQFRQSWNSPWYQNEPCLAPELISIVLVFGLIPLLALLFGVISKKRGYRCGISTAGLIIGSIGIAICTIASLYLSQFL